MAPANLRDPVQVERKAAYQGVPQWGIDCAAESTPSKAIARKWADLENAARRQAAARAARPKGRA